MLPEPTPPAVQVRLKLADASEHTVEIDFGSGRATTIDGVYVGRGGAGILDGIDLRLPPGRF